MSFLKKYTLILLIGAFVYSVLIPIILGEDDLFGSILNRFYAMAALITIFVWVGDGLVGPLRHFVQPYPAESPHVWQVSRWWSLVLALLVALFTSFIIVAGLTQAPSQQITPLPTYSIERPLILLRLMCLGVAPGLIHLLGCWLIGLVMRHNATSAS